MNRRLHFDTCAGKQSQLIVQEMQSTALLKAIFMCGASLFISRPQVEAVCFLNLFTTHLTYLNTLVVHPFSSMLIVSPCLCSSNN